MRLLLFGSEADLVLLLHAVLLLQSQGCLLLLEQVQRVRFHGSVGVGGRLRRWKEGGAAAGSGREGLERPGLGGSRSDWR